MVFPLIFAAATAVFGAASVLNQQKAQKSQRRAEELQRQQMNLRAAQERRQAIRQMRIAQAQAANVAENQGVADSSGARGGQGSIVTQGNANLAFLDRNSQLTNAAQSWMDRASQQMGQASMWGGLSSLAQIGMGMDWDKLGGAKVPPVNNINRGFNATLGKGNELSLGQMVYYYGKPN